MHNLPQKIQGNLALLDVFVVPFIGVVVDIAAGVIGGDPTTERGDPEYG